MLFFYVTFHTTDVCAGTIPYGCWCHCYCWELTRSPPAPISKVTVLRAVDHLGPIIPGFSRLSDRRSSWGTENLRSNYVDTFIDYSGGSKLHPVWRRECTPFRVHYWYIFCFANSRLHILCLPGTREYLTPVYGGH